MFGTLAQLKSHLLAPALASKGSWDDVLTTLGDGVHTAFDRFTNRALAYNAAHVDIFSADRSHWFLRGYPVVSITSIEEQATITTWSDMGTPASLLQRFNPNSGLIDFGTTMGDETLVLRVTYAGGYAVDTGDVGWTQPAGSTLLPEDLRLAWLLQCEKIWESHDKLGVKIAQNDGAAQVPSSAMLAQLELIPLVKDMLRPYIRFAMI